MPAPKKSPTPLIDSVRTGPAEAESDAQLDTAPANGLTVEVLTEDALGHRLVHRVNAVDVPAAVTAVEGSLQHGTRVVGAAPAGKGLGVTGGRS